MNQTLQEIMDYNITIGQSPSVSLIGQGTLVNLCAILVGFIIIALTIILWRVRKV